MQQLLLAGPQVVNNHLLSGTTINTLKVQAERFTSKVAGRARKPPRRLLSSFRRPEDSLLQVHTSFSADRALR